MSDGTLTISVLFTDGLPVFRWKADDVRWSLVDSIGQPSIMSAKRTYAEVVSGDEQTPVDGQSWKRAYQQENEEEALKKAIQLSKV